METQGLLRVAWGLTGIALVGLVLPGCKTSVRPSPALQSGGAEKAKASCSYGGMDGLPTGVTVDDQRDRAEYHLSRTKAGPSIAIHVAIADALDLRIEAPAPGHPNEAIARANVVGAGLSEFRVSSSGELLAASLHGRALDLKSKGTRYADGTIIDVKEPPGFPKDFNQRLSALMARLASAVPGCQKGPPPDPASCPIPPPPVQPPGTDVAGVGCGICIGAAWTAFSACAAAAAVSCLGVGAFCAFFAEICIGICDAISIGVCLAAAIFATFACLNSSVCCPVPCNGACCPSGAACIDGGCCEVSCGSGLCCPHDNACIDSPTLARSVPPSGCGTDTVCCPSTQQCGATCCAEPPAHARVRTLCVSPSAGTCCSGPTGVSRDPNAGGPCPGAAGGCCSGGQACAGRGVCCLAGTECSDGKCCPVGKVCAGRNALGDDCCPNDAPLLCACGPGGLSRSCFAGACPSGTVQSFPACSGIQPTRP